MGKEQPVASMDLSGKIIWAKHNEIQTVNVARAQGEVVDGERLPLAVKDLGNCEVYPQMIKCVSPLLGLRSCQRRDDSCAVGRVG